MSVEYKFETYQLAVNWAKENSGNVISRNSSGEGYIGIIKASQSNAHIDKIDNSNLAPSVANAYIDKFDYSNLDPTVIKSRLSDIKSNFYISIGYRNVDRLDRAKVNRYLIPLNVHQLHILRAAVEVGCMKVYEGFIMGNDHRKGVDDSNTILRLINENIATKEHENRRKKFFQQPKPKRYHASRRKTDDMDEIYEAVSSGNGEDAYLSDGMWITPDGKVYDGGH